MATSILHNLVFVLCLCSGVPLTVARNLNLVQSPVIDRVTLFSGTSNKPVPSLDSNVALPSLHNNAVPSLDNDVLVLPSLDNNAVVVPSLDNDVLVLPSLDRGAAALPSLDSDVLAASSLTYKHFRRIRATITGNGCSWGMRWIANQCVTLER